MKNLFKIDKILPLAIFATCMLVYFVFWSGHHYSIDGVVMFENAKTLLFHGSFRMDPPVRWGMDFFESKWSIGLTLLYIPALAFLSETFLSGDKWIRDIPFKEDLKRNPVLLNNSPYRYSSFVNPLVTATSAIVLYYICRELGFSKKKAVLAALIFGLFSPAAPYSKYDYAQPLASLMLLLAILFLLKTRSKGRRWLGMAGMCMGAAVLTRSEMFLAPGMVLVVASFFLNGKPRRFVDLLDMRRILDLLIFSLPMMFFVLINQFVNYQKFGSWLFVGYQPSIEFDLNLNAWGIALLGNTISPGRGVLIYFPLAILSLPGLWVINKRDRFAGRLLAVILLSAFVLYSAWGDWSAGLSWGPRLLIPLFPYLTLMGVSGFSVLQRVPRPIAVGLFSLLIILGALVAFQGLFYNFLVYYSQQKLPNEVTLTGLHHFKFIYSPVFNGWKGGGDRSWGDLYWLLPRALKYRWVFIFAITTLGVSVVAWGVYFFRKSPPAVE